MIGLIGIVGLVAFAIWAGRRFIAPRPRADADAIDHEELEAAEQAVREADGAGDDASDWGPGAPPR